MTEHSRLKVPPALVKPRGVAARAEAKRTEPGSGPGFRAAFRSVSDDSSRAGRRGQAVQAVGLGGSGFAGLAPAAGAAAGFASGLAAAGPLGLGAAGFGA